MEEERKIKLVDLNPYITCKICSGYLIDATTISECLHTFCKSCLVKHLEENNNCPECSIIIHQSHPLQYINFDRTMQDIVYKVVPKLQENEWRRELEYYKSRGLTCPKNIVVPGVSIDQITTATAGSATDLANEERRLREINLNQKTTEHINLALVSKIISGPHKLDQLTRRFIRCNARATIIHLKKYLAKQLFKNQELYNQVDIWCNNEPIHNEYSLKYIYITKWRYFDSPLVLNYQRKW